MTEERCDGVHHTKIYRDDNEVMRCNDCGWREDKEPDERCGYVTLRAEDGPCQQIMGEGMTHYYCGETEDSGIHTIDLLEVEVLDVVITTVGHPFLGRPVALCGHGLVYHESDALGHPYERR